MLKKLRTKFICFSMAIVTVMLCVVFGLIYHSTQQNLERQSIQMMEQVRKNSFFRNTQENQKEQEDQIPLPYLILSIDPDDKVTCIDDRYLDSPDPGVYQELAKTVLDQNMRIGVLEPYDLRFSYHSSPRGDTIVFADISWETDTLHSLVTDCFVVNLLCLLAFLGLSVLLARYATKPVEIAWAQQQQFVADASHELKTPLTVILTNAELLQTPQLTESSRHQFTENILAMSHQMRGLVESLLELARVDNGILQTRLAPLNLSNLVSDGILPFEPLYFEHGKELQTHIEDNIYIMGSYAHLKQLLDILLDNALKYSYLHSTATIRLEKQGTQCLLSVTDPGEPLSEEELAHIFKRFYRADKARSMNHSYGLGLPIAQGIVHDHRGKIWAVSANGLNTFYVQLPCCSAKKDISETNRST